VASLRIPKPYLWVLGGLGLGGIAALVVGILVFWVHPALQKARSPLAEISYPPLVLRYLKSSPVASKIEDLKSQLRDQWLETLKELGLSSQVLPSPIYLYVFASPAEVPAGISARAEEERTSLAVADLVLSRATRGDLARLAGSLAFGRPGNPLFPRGLSLYFADPRYPWAAEAGAWAERYNIREIWANADRLLPKDPWEDLYFQLNAPWAGTTLTLEKMRTVLAALNEPKQGGGRLAEIFAAAVAQWVLTRFGPQGVQIFWKSSSWEAAANLMQKDPNLLAQEFQAFLLQNFRESPEREHLLALKELNTGRAEEALQLLANVDDPKAREIRGLAYLAKGEVGKAIELLGEKASELWPLLSAPKVRKEPVIVVGAGDEARALQAQQVLARLTTIWPEIPELLPEDLVFYVLAQAPSVSTPWGVVWVRDPEEIPRLACRLALEALCPWGLPTYKTLVEGLILRLVYPERDFRAEARALLEAGRWVSLTQNLFGVYPQELAEAEAGAFVTFLWEKFGVAGLRKFWESLYEGASIFRASELAFSRSFYALEEDLKNWVKRP
jgi:hypothetical protein